MIERIKDFFSIIGIIILLGVICLCCLPFSKDVFEDMYDE